MNYPNKEVFPALEIPYEFTGDWTPDFAQFSQYGTKLASPAIIVTAANWPVGGPVTPAKPQFATDAGQQIGEEFFLYGTAMANVAGKFAGFLGNNAAWSNRYGAPGGYPMLYLAQCMAPDNWQQIEGQPYTAFSGELPPLT